MVYAWHRRLLISRISWHRYSITGQVTANPGLKCKSQFALYLRIRHENYIWIRNLHWNQTNMLFLIPYIVDSLIVSIYSSLHTVAWAVRWSFHYKIGLSVRIRWHIADGIPFATTSHERYNHYSDVTRASRRLKLPDTWLFVLQCFQADNKGNNKARLAYPYRRESTGERLIPLTKDPWCRNPFWQLSGNWLSDISAVMFIS